MLGMPTKPTIEELKTTHKILDWMIGYAILRHPRARASMAALQQAKILVAAAIAKPAGR